MRVTFEETSFEELREWGLADRKIFKKIMELIEDIRRSPKVGLGKPEILSILVRDIGHEELLKNIG